MGETIDVKVPADAIRLQINGQSVLCRFSGTWHLAPEWLHKALGEEKLVIASGIYGTPKLKIFPEVKRCEKCGHKLPECKDGC